VVCCPVPASTAIELHRQTKDYVSNKRVSRPKGDAFAAQGNCPGAGRASPRGTVGDAPPRSRQGEPRLAIGEAGSLETDEPLALAVVRAETDRDGQSGSAGVDP
jgi:hypothetical protein